MNFCNGINRYITISALAILMICTATANLFGAITISNQLPSQTLVIENDTVLYASDFFTKINVGDTTGWASVPQAYIRAKSYSSEDMGVETGTADCLGIAAGGTKTKVYPYSTSSVMHMNVSNVRTARAYVVVDNNYRGLRIHANKLSDIDSLKQNLAESELTAEYQISTNTSNKVMDFVLDLKDLNPKEKYMLTLRGYGTASSYSYLYAIKLYASNTPTLRIESGDINEEGGVTSVVTAKSSMTPVVVTWTAPNGGTAVPVINWTNGSQPEWLNVNTDYNTKTITISGTPESNDYATEDTLSYQIDIEGGTSILCKLKVNRHLDNAPSFGVIEKNFSYLPGETANISIPYSNAQGYEISGLPSGFESAEDKDGNIIISGIASEEESYPKVYQYTIVPNPLSDYEGEIKTYNGTITIIDPSAPKVAFIYTNDDVSNLDITGKVYNVINGNYDVTAILSDNIEEYDTETLSTYDLIVLHESANSSSTGALNVGTWIGNKPVLNTKAHMYGKDNWPMMGASITDDGDSLAYISDIYQKHTIFTDVNSSNKILNIGGNVRGIYLPGKKEDVLYQIATNSLGNSAIVEENNGSTGENKYMMIALGADNSEKAITESLTSDGQKLIKNACDYLLDNTELWTTTERNHEAEIKSFTINGGIGEISGNNITVTLLADTTSTDELTNVIPTIVISDNATITNDSVAMDFSNEQEVTYTVTSEDKSNTNTYIVVVKLIDAAINAPYLDSIGIGSGYVKPDGIYCTNGIITYMPAYAKEDAYLWTQEGESSNTASILRVSANASVTIIARDPSTVTLGLSSTGGREFKAYIDGTMISTTKVKSLTKADVNIEVNQKGVHFITIENVGTGNSEIGYIKITALSDAGKTTDNKEIENSEKIITDVEYYAIDGKKLHKALENVPTIRVTRYNNGEIKVDKIHIKQ